MRLELHNGFYLSPVRHGDEAAYVEHFKDVSTVASLLRTPFPYTEEDATAWVQSRLEAAPRDSGHTSFAMRREDGYLMGGAGLVLNSGADQHRAELGYWVAKDYRAQRLATHAARVLIQYGFKELGLMRIEATVSPFNMASQRVLENAGFIREGLLSGYHSRNGVLLDVYMYAFIGS